MIKTIIIEDEQNTLEVLKKMISLINTDIQIVGEARYVKDAVSLIEATQPKLVFMDIQLENGTGFDVLKQLNNINFKIIFTTAYNQYAIKAFKFNAVDYLLKPIDPKELKNAIEQAINSINQQENYNELLRQIEQQSENNIVLSTTEQKHIIPIKSIIHLEAEGAYTIFITNDKTIVTSKHLKYYQELLGDDFIRCHQSHLVCKQKIKSIDKKGVLHLSNGDTVPVSRRNKMNILSLLQ